VKNVVNRQIQSVGGLGGSHLLKKA